MKQGLSKIKPDRRDFSLLRSYGATPTDAKGLPPNFSLYDNQIIPNQENIDQRFTPPLPPLPYGCTGETGTFDSGIQDTATYRPDMLYAGTYPYTNTTGRDMREVLGCLTDKTKNFLVTSEGVFGPKRSAYFNVYATNGIDDFDAAKISLWLNQGEKRGIWAGSWWYPEFATVGNDGVLPMPSLNTNTASLHAHLISGWKTIGGVEYLESLSWQGMEYGDHGKVYFSRELWNKLMAQPYTGMFSITKLGAGAPIPVGLQAIVDHFVYWFRNLFHV